MTTMIMMMSSVSAAVVVETSYSHTQSFFLFKHWFDLGENSDLSQLVFRLDCTVLHS